VEENGLWRQQSGGAAAVGNRRREEFAIQSETLMKESGLKIEINIRI
jgi:hypothetical protein